MTNNRNIEYWGQEVFETPKMAIGKNTIRNTNLEEWISIWMHAHFYGMDGEVEELKEKLIFDAMQFISNWTDLFELEYQKKKEALGIGEKK